MVFPGFLLVRCRGSVMFRYEFGKGKVLLSVLLDVVMVVRYG